MNARRALRLGASILGSVVLLFVVAAGGVYVRGERIINKTLHPPAHARLVIPSDSASVARGEHIAHSFGTCTLCHGVDLGGGVYMDAGPMGMVAGPNLTGGAGGIAGQLTDDDWVRAIRYGVGRDSASLLVMPSEVFVHLSDGDLASLIAYLKQMPPVDRSVPQSRFRWLGKLLTGAGKLNILPAGKTEPLISVPNVAPAVSAEYGRYLAEAGGCAGCHGYGLSGGRVAGPPGLPPASNLTPAGPIRAWTEADFFRAMRQGTRPDGTQLNEFMPWRQLGQMTDDELRAIWLYLQSVPAKPFGHK